MNVKRKLRKARGSKKISVRFRKANIALFLAAFTVIVLATIMVLRTITDTVSKDYARLYSTSTSGNLSTYLHKEIALVEKAANSDAVKNWFADEYNQEKKAAALAEMLEIIDVLYSDNLYYGIHGSLNEYSLEQGFSVEDVNPHATLDPDYFDDAWYFECTYGGEEFAAVLPNTDEAGARLIADRMLENVRLCNIPHEKSEAAGCVTVSIGAVTGGVTHTHSGADFVKKADEALYSSKRNGRNRFTGLPL